MSKYFWVGSHLRTVCSQDLRAQIPESSFQPQHLPTIGPVANFPYSFLYGGHRVKCDNVLKHLTQCLPLKEARINGSYYHYYSYYYDHHSSEG